VDLRDPLIPYEPCSPLTVAYCTSAGQIFGEEEEMMWVYSRMTDVKRNDWRMFLVDEKKNVLAT
jgi:hypothetical protein